jgi:hypothetical protein
MTRTLLSSIAAAALFSLLTSAPAGAGGSGWGCRTCGYSNGTQLTGVVTTNHVAATAKPQRNAIGGAIGNWSNDGTEDRAGKPAAIAQLKTRRGGQGSGSGWSCRTCGFSNGPQLTGVGGRAPSIPPAGGTVTLPSGETLVLR